ncbi:MAG: hypothetical protein V1734_03085 [Nanoarchaeota archaeon]
MAYKKFSTKQADYSLVYAMHSITTKEDIFEDEKIQSLDAIVLESSGLDPRILEIPAMMDINAEIQYEFIGNQAHKHGKPIYFVDVGVYNEILYIELLLWHKSLLINKLLIDDSSGKPEFRKGVINSELARIFIASVERFPPMPVVEMRNAITAKKLEDYLVPELSNILGKKPNLALVYGAAHTGIEGCLKSKLYRDILLKAYSLTGYFGLCTDTFNDIWETIPCERDEESYPILGLEWIIRHYKCPSSDS